VSGQLHAPATLLLAKEPPVPIGKEAGWPPEPVWMIQRSENSLSYQDLNSNSSAVQPVASHVHSFFHLRVVNLIMLVLQSLSLLLFVTSLKAILIETCQMCFKLYAVIEREINLTRSDLITTICNMDFNLAVQKLKDSCISLVSI
jgi:hypothetical protein